MKRGWKITLIFLFIIILILAIYFTVFFYYSCDGVACFEEHQKNCDKTKFVKDDVDTTWGYRILGKDNGNCEIEVEVRKIKTGTIDKKKLEGMSMFCYIPLGIVDAPESDLSLCHGELKEELQAMIINKLHAYIVENVGEIGEELREVV